MADVIPPTTLVFVSTVSEKCTSSSASPIQMIKWWKTISTEVKLDVISWL